MSLYIGYVLWAPNAKPVFRGLWSSSSALEVSLLRFQTPWRQATVAGAFLKSQTTECMCTTRKLVVCASEVGSVLLCSNSNTSLKNEWSSSAQNKFSEPRSLLHASHCLYLCIIVLAAFMTELIVACTISGIITKKRVGKMAPGKILWDQISPKIHVTEIQNYTLSPK